jgi:hypothetical protein
MGHRGAARAAGTRHLAHPSFVCAALPDRLRPRARGVRDCVDRQATARWSATTAQ